MRAPFRAALLGNPNTGKSTVFNALTGLNQKVGNFAGVTVDKKTGYFEAEGRTVELIDLPGIYSLYAKAKDEQIAFEVLCGKEAGTQIDTVILIADAANIKRNLLLYTQVADLNIPVILVLNMADIAKRMGVQINVQRLSERLGIRVVSVTARENIGINGLKKVIAASNGIPTQNPTIDVYGIGGGVIDEVKQEFSLPSPYEALQWAHQYQALNLSPSDTERMRSILDKHQFKSAQLQIKETIARYQFISEVLEECVMQSNSLQGEDQSNKIDRILTHRQWGLPIFLGILFIVFQAVFSFAEYPMDFIESGFTFLQSWTKAHLPEGVLTDLLADGILAGLGGVFMFLPQIVILFLFIAILEDTGYMARVTFMMDKFMRKAGLNGKSIIPLISGMACAVPAIMAARTIENWKERIATILVTPLMSCSARLPVYTLIISLIIPDEKVGGIFSLQGIWLFGLYLLGFAASLLSAWVISLMIKQKSKAYFIMELPIYRLPRWSHIGLDLYEKAKTFLWSAGRVIVAVSIVLWILASYGPSELREAVTDKYETMQAANPDEDYSAEQNAELLEHSYAGYLGKMIEPVIKPLGFDWKIGIALITSFAAREVFIGTMATIYSVGGNDDDDDDLTGIREQLAKATNAETGLPAFTFATGLSLIIFYAFAMQCMSTVATVYKETKSWVWPAVQFAYMTGLAYVGSYLCYTFFS